MNITPMYGSPSPASVATDLRKLADLIESDSDGFTAACIARLIQSANVWPGHAAAADYTPDEIAKAVAEMVARLETLAVAPTTSRRHTRGDTDYVDHTIPLASVTLVVTELAGA